MVKVAAKLCEELSKAWKVLPGASGRLQEPFKQLAHAGMCGLWLILQV